MTGKEAYAIVSKEYEDKEAVSCFEYNSMFVFNLVNKNNKKKILDWLISVDKKSSKISVFSPMSLSLEEYKSGKNITDFKD